MYPVYPSIQNESCLCNRGTDDTATVYAAELRAIVMALEVTKERFIDGQWQDRLAERGAVILTDNQAALRVIQNPRMPSGQVYLEGCLRLLEWCSRENKIQVELRWIPGHEGIPGNETADMLAKEAATTKDINIHHTNTSIDHKRYIRLAAAARKSIRRESWIAWEKAWRMTARRIGRLIEAPITRIWRAGKAC